MPGAKKDDFTPKMLFRCTDSGCAFPSFWLAARVVADRRAVRDIGLARAGELEDCNGPIPVETACTAVIDDASRPVDDRLKAYASRARLNTSRSKLDLASTDVGA